MIVIVKRQFSNTPNFSDRFSLLFLQKVMKHNCSNDRKKVITTQVVLVAKAKLFTENSWHDVKLRDKVQRGLGYSERPGYLGRFA